jgi:hypothetical protein
MHPREFPKAGICAFVAPNATPVRSLKMKPQMVSRKQTSEGRCSLCDCIVSEALDEQDKWPQIQLDEVPSLAETSDVAVEVRRALLASEQVLRPLIDIGAVCRAGRFCLRERRLGGARGGLEAVLAPAPVNRFEIHVDPEPLGGWRPVPYLLRGAIQRQRLRFRVAHEIGHSFFYDRSAEVPRRHIGNSQRQEEFCDRFAADLLLPRDVVAATEPSPQALVALAVRYDVSLQLAVRSFSAQWPDLLVALLVQGPEGFERQWTAGDLHLPVGWWRDRWLHSLSRWGQFELKAVAKAWRVLSVQALRLPERNQVLLFGWRS